MYSECFAMILSTLTLLMNGPALVHIGEKHDPALYQHADLAADSDCQEDFMLAKCKNFYCTS